MRGAAAAPLPFCAARLAVGSAWVSFSANGDRESLEAQIRMQPRGDRVRETAVPGRVVLLYVMYQLCIPGRSAAWAVLRMSSLGCGSHRRTGSGGICGNSSLPCRARLGHCADQRALRVANLAWRAQICGARRPATMFERTILRRQIALGRAGSGLPLADDDIGCGLGQRLARSGSDVDEGQLSLLRTIRPSTSGDRPLGTPPVSGARPARCRANSSAL